MSKKVRLDRRLVTLGLAANRDDARALIESGAVRVDGLPAVRIAAQVDVSQAVVLTSHEHVWVGRGALKLLGALDAFGIDPTNWTCADLGASTGGFTEVLLRRGARRVYAIDVGRGLLHRRLEVDERVVVMDGVNARYLSVGGDPLDPSGAVLPEPMRLVVGDLSFIGLERVLASVRRILCDDGEAVLLVKPQFEVGRSELASGGRVRNDGARQAAIRQVRRDAETGGFQVVAGVDSSLPGAKAGNVEHFLRMRLGPSGGL